MSNTGFVYWITGLSGAGKTTLAQILCDQIRAQSEPIILLDGDTLREIFAGNMGHERAERLILAMNYARLCREISRQGINVACATISMFHEVHAWNRENIMNYREIYLRVSMDTLKARDTKGLYKRAEKGEISNVYGIDLMPEEPRNPDIIIENEGLMTREEAVRNILSIGCLSVRG